MSVPDSLKAIKPYLERGADLKSREPVVAYHCRLYALQEAMRLRSTLPKTDMGFIIGLMDELEADKAVLGELDDAGVQLENYGLDLFLRADDADRAGRSDLRTGKAFFAAAQVLECCKQFGQLPDDLAEKIKYAKVRYLEIVKATKEGRPPAPPRQTEPPPVFDHPEPPADDTAGGTPSSYLSLPEPPPAELPPPTGIGPPPPPAYAPPAYTATLRPAALPTSPSALPAGMAMPAPPAGMAMPGGSAAGFKPTVAVMRDAMGRCQSAVNALQFQDHVTATAEIQAALQLLTVGSGPKIIGLD